MSGVTYKGDPNVYSRYKIQGRYHVKCLATRIVDGRKQVCDYQNVREDHHKARVKDGKIHNCNFIIPEEPANSIMNFYLPKNQKTSSGMEFTEEGLKGRFMYLIGKKNISIDTAASDEFYEFITYCIAFGMSIQTSSENFIEEAKKAYRHYKDHALHDCMIRVANDMRKQIMKEFSKYPFVSVSIDEGACGGVKNLDFNIENPLGSIKPFTAYTEEMSRCTANDYVQVLLNGLSSIHRENIRIGCVVCDGNLAQKKAFSAKWDGSLRNLKEYPYLAHIIFIPCLCHRTNNGFKNTIKQIPPLAAFQEELHSLAQACKYNKKDLGKTCPTFVSTRWVYDYDLAVFIVKHRDQITQFADLPGGIDAFLPVARIFKLLVLQFENPSTPIFEAFPIIEKAITSFNRLITDGVPFAEEFKKRFIEQTLDSKEGGVWILAYLLTRSGHDDFYHRIMECNFTPEKEEGLSDILPRYNAPNDPLEQELEFILEQFLKEEEEGDCIQDEGIEEDEDWVEDDAPSESEEEDFEGMRKAKSYLTIAKETLSKLLHQEGLFKASHAHAMCAFNGYLENENPLQEYQLENPVGYSWLQIRANAASELQPIANLALKLHSAGCSEASCERTTSAQRLIYTSRRRSSSTLTLDARLTIMRADSKPSFI